MDQPVDMPDITRGGGSEGAATPLLGSGTEPVHPIEEVLGAGAWQNAGTFRFWRAGERWEWSDEVAQIHGYAPGAVQPTTELLLSHKHPDDREQVANTIARTVETGEPFCSRHRIIDTRGRVRHVLVVGDDMYDDKAKVVGTSGYYVDITDTLAEDRRQTLDGALPELYTARAAIEQAKGALRLVYGISAEQALRVLVWRSQETGVELRVLATQLLSELTTLDGPMVELRTRFDHLLLTVHERM
ncbi:PAS and ANTAR domain-containing protein [Nocardia brasiliensis]|uniref:histidine kinase n=2 Tax=Nocardia brasiliensis TaxID=37326 RepID=K0EUH5_NOCB7|nr:PAS and ANTAR domain-containing protein [Nocardia brasiliensis]AFU01177.1 transcription antitermination regulator [Nocardia brasiliensis ATCC 700358]